MKKLKLWETVSRSL